MADIETELWPRDYADIQRKVDVAMRHDAKDCIGEACDSQFPCIRHRRTAELVGRYLRRKK